MRELRISGIGQVEWAAAIEPALKSRTAALVRPVAVATCDFDHLMVAGAMPVPLPLAIGHECVATVVAVGDDVRSVGVGDTVVVPYQISCGSCDACCSGRTSSCAAVPWLSCYGLGPMSGDWGGMMSDLVTVPYADAMLVPLPVGVSAADAAAASCNIVDAYNAVGPALAERPGSAVLVCSAAFTNIGLYSVVLAQALGAGRVDFLHPDPVVRDKASRLGARVLESVADIEDSAYPVTVDTSMNPEVLAAAIRATAAGGMCTASTMYAGDTTGVPLMAMFERCMTLRTGQPHARGLLDSVLGLMADGTLNPGLVTDSVIDWEDAPAAFCAGAGKHICVRDD
jgi:alcohol dehydrogenase